MSQVLDLEGESPLALATRPLEGIPTDRPDLRVSAPADPELRTLFQLAQAKVERQLGHAPGTRAEWNQVTAQYDALTTKQRGSIAALAARHQEVCKEIPDGD